MCEFPQFRLKCGPHLTFLKRVNLNIAFCLLNISIVSGTVYIDQHSLPESDAFNLFPRLFKKNHPKRLREFQDVVTKIKSMGLGHLIEMTDNRKGEGSSDQDKSVSNVQWWYIGE